MSIGAFDIDGTIMHHPSRVEYLNEASLANARPDLDVCRRIRTLIEAGVKVHFITGRCHPVNNFTLKQLREFIHPAIQADQLHTQDEFTTYEAMADWKATILRHVGAQWYVGDHTADYDASQKAGIPFQHAAVYSEQARTLVVP